eukprot:gene30218-39424_t
MYFKETQTSPQGQVHLFPVIMDGRLLYETMMQKIGPKAVASFIEAETIPNSPIKLLKAAQAGRVDEVAALLDQGAHLHFTDQVGKTALDLASSENIRQLLRARLETSRRININLPRQHERVEPTALRIEPRAANNPLTAPPLDTANSKEPRAASPQQPGHRWKALGDWDAILDDGDDFCDEEFISQVAAFEQFEREKYPSMKLPLPTAVNGKEPGAGAAPHHPPPPPVKASPDFAIFRLLLSEDPGALPYASLREWTGDFKAIPAGDGPHGIIGKGVFGEVFKGLAIPPDGTNEVRLAVKRMDYRALQLDGAAGGGVALPEAFIASYRREIHVLSRFRHPNIVRLIGFSEPCPERREPPCLVYELLALGSLSGQLRDDGQAALLPWQTRVDILLQISTAINYLHCHNPGYPAYHRDIKADNIALSADYTAKLIDCGLSKYIAEDGQGRSIHSATGGRFGTPGYMCPFYNEGATNYDAKSEMYSFGIVLLEVLSGILQGSTGSDGKKIMLHRSIRSLTVDARAGSWPEDCARQLLDLAKQCIAEYDDRIATMIIVMQRLRQIKADYCPEKSQFQQQIADLIAQNEALRRERDQAAAAAAQSIRKCLVCYDDELLATDGFECTANRHFVCKKNGCFAQITKDQCGSKGRFAANGCKILCTVPDCGEVVPDHEVAVHAGEEGFGAFLR